MDKTHDFQTVVESSKLLTKAQKRELLVDPSTWPHAYKQHLMDLLVTFDAQEEARYKSVRQKLEESVVRFENALIQENIPEETRKEYLDKAKKQMEEFFSVDSTS